MNVFADRLDVLGVLAGVFLVLVALGTAAGTPWQYSGGTIVMVVQVFGVIATAAIGVLLVWLAHVKA